MFKPQKALKEFVRLELTKDNKEINGKTVKEALATFFEKRAPKKAWVRVLREYMINRGITSCEKIPNETYIGLASEIEYDILMESQATTN